MLITLPPPLSPSSTFHTPPYATAESSTRYATLGQGICSQANIRNQAKKVHLISPITLPKTVDPKSYSSLRLYHRCLPRVPGQITRCHLSIIYHEANSTPFHATSLNWNTKDLGWYPCRPWLQRPHHYSQRLAPNVPVPITIITWTWASHRVLGTPLLGIYVNPERKDPSTI